MGKILLTGGGGMVGRNILEHTAANDWEIFAPSSVDLDLKDFSATRRYIDKVSPDVIIHAAGLVGGISANIASPVAFLDTNLLLGRNVVLASIDVGVSNLINLGSACMYPRNAPNPLLESSILTGELEPTNEGYALAKVMTAKLCLYAMIENPKLNYKTIIPCNIYGRHDKFDPGRSHLLPAIIAKMHEAIKERRDVIDIWGDGLARREFMYAADLADAILQGAKDVEQLPNLMNCGLGYDYTITEYYEAVARVLGWEGEFNYDLTKPVGMARKLCDIGLQERWGWAAKTSLKEGIAYTNEFYVERT